MGQGESDIGFKKADFIAAVKALTLKTQPMKGHLTNG